MFIPRSHLHTGVVAFGFLFLHQGCWSLGFFSCSIAVVHSCCVFALISLCRFYVSSFKFRCFRRFLHPWSLVCSLLVHSDKDCLVSDRRCWRPFLLAQFSRIDSPSSYFSEFGYMRHVCTKTGLLLPSLSSCFLLSGHTVRQVDRFCTALAYDFLACSVGLIDFPSSSQFGCIVFRRFGGQSERGGSVLHRAAPSPLP